MSVCVSVSVCVCVMKTWHYIYLPANYFKPVKSTADAVSWMWTHRMLVPFLLDLYGK